MAALDHASGRPLSEARSFDTKWLIIGAAVLIVAWLALVPLVFLVWQSFMTPLSPGMPARFTLANAGCRFSGYEVVMACATHDHDGAADNLSAKLGGDIDTADCTAIDEIEAFVALGSCDRILFDELLDAGP